MPELPSGTIVLWSKPIGQIPAGFVICDGTHGTPDLRDRFIVGAGNTYDPGDTGGSKTHDHDFTSDGHYHTFPAGFAMQVGANFKTEVSSETDTGTTNAKNHLPPYHALTYIMKT